MRSSWRDNLDLKINFSHRPQRVSEHHPVTAFSLCSAVLNSRRGCLARSEKRKFATLHVLRRQLWPHVRVMCGRRATFTPRRVIGAETAFDFQIAFFIRFLSLDANLCQVLAARGEKSFSLTHTARLLI